MNGQIEPCDDGDDRCPETRSKCNFYRRATDKIVGVSDETAAFLNTFFPP
ncbi:hypothetical protein [Rhizobium sp. LjRoot254]